jgi:CBS domain-containing protein
MTASMILKDKGSTVHRIQAGATLCDAAKILHERRIGAVVVADAAGALAGVLSERDIVRAIAGEGPAALDRPVRDFMSKDVVTCTEQDRVEALMSLMTGRRIRHLPVMRGNELVGIISIGDVVKQRIAATEMEANALKDYIATG